MAFQTPPTTIVNQVWLRAAADVEPFCVRLFEERWYYCRLRIVLLFWFEIMSCVSSSLKNICSCVQEIKSPIRWANESFLCVLLVPHFAFFLVSMLLSNQQHADWCFFYLPTLTKHATYTAIWIGGISTSQRLGEFPMASHRCRQTLHRRENLVILRKKLVISNKYCTCFHLLSNLARTYFAAVRHECKSAQSPWDGLGQRARGHVWSKFQLITKCKSKPQCEHSFFFASVKMENKIQTLYLHHNTHLHSRSCLVARSYSCSSLILLLLIAHLHPYSTKCLSRAYTEPELVRSQNLACAITLSSSTIFSLLVILAEIPSFKGTHPRSLCF